MTIQKIENGWLVVVGQNMFSHGTSHYAKDISDLVVIVERLANELSIKKPYNPGGWGTAE